MSSILSTKMVKTRKPHRCFGCAREFPAGTEMRFDVCVDDGIFNCYLCKTCVDVVQDYGNELDDGFCFGDLRDDALEMEKRRNNKDD